MNNSNLCDSNLRCSQACTRAGLIALILSMVALTLLQPLKRERWVEALGKYINHRIQLKEGLEELENDDCWKVFKANENGKTAVSFPILKFRNIFCSYAGTKTKFEIVDNPPSLLDPYGGILRFNPGKRKSLGEKGPPPPENLRILTPLTAGRKIITAITVLDDNKVLRLARGASNEVNFSIYRWEELRWVLLRKKGTPLIAGNNLGITIDRDVPSDKGVSTTGITSDKDVPSDKRTDSFLKDWTLEDLRQLSRFEFLGLEEFTTLTRGLVLNFKWIPLSLLPSSMLMAIQIGLLFCVVYFWLFQNEAKHAENFPAPGTIFCAFSRSRISRILFLTFVALPSISTGIIAANAEKEIILTWILFVIILIFSLLIASGSLNQKPTSLLLNKTRG